MLREFFRKTARTIKEAFAGMHDMQTLFDRQQVKLQKTREYEADDHGGVKSWSYRLTFDNQARKRRFMTAILGAPPQPWDKFVRWMDDQSNLNGEITVEVFCKVPPEEAAKFRYQFEAYITRDLVITD